MAKKPARQRPPRKLRNFTLGSEQAETDPLLSDAFYESADYLSMEDRDDPRCFFVGRTGVGKSALLQHLHEEQADHVVRISPEDLSLTYVANLDVLKKLSEMDVRLDPFFIALWKHVLLIEIIKHRYGVNTPEAKQTVMQTITEKIRRDPSKVAALEYLNEFHDRFWCETYERVRDITTHFQQDIGAEAQVSFTGPVSPSVGVKQSGTFAEDLRIEQVPRYQHIVDATQLPRLNQMIQVLNDNILDSAQNYTYVVIDDLDRDWVDEAVYNDLIRCLFRAVMDLKRVRNLKVIVALRTNILEALDFGSRTGGQVEKFRALTVQMNWNAAELEEMLDERAAVTADRSGVDEFKSVKDLLPVKNRTRGSALEYMLRRTLMRPRDIISYFNECYSASASKRKLSWETIKGAERDYSRNRLLALRDEWRSSYPGIERVFDAFIGKPAKMTQQDLAECLMTAGLLEADDSFPGKDWLAPLTSQMWVDGSNWATACHPLFRLLYKISFLGMVDSRRGSAVFSYEDDGIGSLVRNLEDSESFWVHPTFRAGLDIRHVDEHSGRER